MTLKKIFSTKTRFLGELDLGEKTGLMDREYFGYDKIIGVF